MINPFSSGFVIVFTTDSSKTIPTDVQEFFFTSQYEALEMKDQEVQMARVIPTICAFLFN